MDRLHIINLALAKLGQDSVENLNGQEKRLKTALTFFEPCRNMLMESYPWNFCIKRTRLNAETYTDENNQTQFSRPAFGYKYQYALPKDFLRLLESKELKYIWCGDCEEPVIEGNYLLSNEAGPLNIRYCAVVEDERLWPPLFIDAFALKLAGELCPNVEQSKADKAILFNELAAAVAQAKRVNAIQKPSLDLPPTDFEESRLFV